MLERSPSNNTLSSSVAGTSVSHYDAVSAAKLECDYDTNRSILYQAIEAKQWDYAVSLFTRHQQGKQAATWVVRKETNGKLRWRLLPLHAAIIFGSPIGLIETLLEDYPAACQCKDDQGMLPLHLAFRNEASWEVIEEILTAYPQAIFVSDRKGRKPLEYGSRSISTSSGGSISSMSASKADNNNNNNNQSFKSVVSILDLYGQIVVSGERERSQLESLRLVEASIGKLQETHLNTLTKLKREWESQQEESRLELQSMQEDKMALEERVQEQELELMKASQAQSDLTERMRRLSVAFDEANHSDGSSRTKSSPSNRRSSPATSHHASNEAVLKGIVDDLVHQQKEYHVRFQQLMSQYDKLVEERQQLRAIFVRESAKQEDKATVMIDQFKSWLRHQEAKSKVRRSTPQNNQLQHVSHNPTTGRRRDEEKKVDGTIIDLSDVEQHARRNP